MVKHYAIADIHGMYDIYAQVNEILQPDDIVYFLGDAGDRGYDGFACIKHIYQNPQWIYLKGNHEDLMVKALREHQITFGGKWGSKTNAFDLWMYNGGYETFESWENQGKDYSWIDKLNNLPLQADYTNPLGIKFYFSHAGFTKGNIDELWSTQLLWSRSHFFNSWDEEAYPKAICMHGHTPNELLVHQLRRRGYDSIEPYVVGTPKAISYCNGHKICIDNGVFYSNATVLYDLDEMKTISLFDQSGTVW